MADNTLTEEELKQKQQNPKSVEIDNRKVENHSLADVIAIDKYIASKQAIKKKGFGLRFVKMGASSSR